MDRFSIWFLGATWLLLCAPLAAQTQPTKLTSGNNGDSFGTAVSISGDRVLIGASRDASGGLASGAAYVFAFDGTVWTQEAKLIADDAERVDLFGSAVSISGNRVLIGARGDNCTAGDNCGAAYVFAFDGTSWAQEAKLTADDAGPGDSFGSSVSLSGNRALIGANYADCTEGRNCGSAYIFAFDGVDWTQEAKLTSTDNSSFDQFGASVSLSSNRALIGAWDAQNENTLSGSAYVFVFDDSEWIQEAKLIPDRPPTRNAHFGYSVSLSSDHALVGAYGENSGSGDLSGTAYVFAFDGTAWRQQDRLFDGRGDGFEFFGISVSLSGDRALVGADGSSLRGYQSGQASVISLDPTSLSGADLDPNDVNGPRRFGRAVSISGNRALVGAYGVNDLNNRESGAAYIFDLPTACDRDAPLSFNVTDTGNGDGTDVTADDFNSIGTDPTYGEFVGIRHEADQGPSVYLGGCRFVAFDPFTETVTYTTRPGGVLDVGDTYILASQNGDQLFRNADALFDNPGAFALVEGDVETGASVAAVLDSVVAAVVYDTDREVFASIGGRATAEERIAFAQAVAHVASSSVSAEEITGGTAELTVAPNPVAGQSIVAYELAESADVSVSLYDALGREVVQLAEGPYPTGRHSVALATDDLPVGVYVIRAQIGETVRTAHLTVIR